MNAETKCPQCGRPFPVDAPAGICPQCLLGIGRHVESQAETLDRPGSFTPPKPGQLAQHFPQLEILDLVGHGGMGAVYKARQRGLDRMVALKILPPEVGKDPSFAERFAREARALARLSHPNIVAVHDSGTAGGLYYVLMEYVDGINLREAIQTHELTPAEALAIVPQICEALQYAHDEGVVHRDIKPENILLDKRGRVKIADFGLARLLGHAADNFTLTETHQVMGSLRYMAPEQMEGSHEVDHRADIYSLGVVFYEMLTGELPLGRFDVPSRKVQLDVRVDDVVLRTLEKEPARRYQHASEIKTDVESISRPNLPHHMRGMYGCDYRSKAELFGWPLVHVATGIDPKTGRKRVARGVIAVGDVAIGFLALGGAAIGVFALGGAAVGLFTFGGAAVGLLVAIGGAAAGFGFSCGGVAIGGVAMGGLAIGYYGFGGGAFAVHGMSGMGSDPAAVRFFEPWAMTLMKYFPIFTTIVVLGMTFGMALIMAVAKRHSDAAPPRRDEAAKHPSASGAGCVIVALLLVLMTGGCVVPGLVLWAYLSLQPLEATVIPPPAKEFSLAQEFPLAQELDLGHWTMTDRGPTLTSRGAMAFRLTAEQEDRVNQVLQTVYYSYLEAEVAHTTRNENELGHLVAVVEPFSEREIANLEEQLWSELDKILSVEQQQTMRDLLGVHVAEGWLTGPPHQWRPGILGWGRAGCQVELWKVGTWYHWHGRINVSERKTVIISDKAPELPIEFQRFWTGIN